MAHKIRRFREFPTSILITHLLAKLALGIGLIVLLVQDPYSYAWLIILGILILAIPYNQACIPTYRSLLTKLTMLTIFSTIFFGIKLIGYGWLFIVISLILGLSGMYLIFKR